MKKRRVIGLLIFLTFILFLSAGLMSRQFISSAIAEVVRRPVQAKMSSWVLDKTAGGGETEFLVILDEQADLSAARNLVRKEDKGRFVFDTLMARARMTQAPLLEWLENQRIEHRSFYIVNAILVKGTRELAVELAGRPDVARIEGNPQLTGVMPVERIADDDLNLTVAQTAIEGGVEATGAPYVWGMGFTGQGIVIGGQDTGVRWDHSALEGKYRGSNGNQVDHDYNWHDSIHTGGGICGPDSRIPCDDDNHGTHTMGTAVGSDGGQNQIGVAPGAKFIACRNMDRGVGTPATYLECFQFFLAPYPVNGTPEEGDPSKAPDITTNSWTCPPDEGCSPGTLKAAVEAQRAAGIMTIVSAGNTGAACSTVVDPPAIYDSAYSVGAINGQTGEIAGFSGRGPVTIDGSLLVKPDIAAPGVAVRSAVKSGGYSMFSGTSMATPHVAGAVALLWSAYPELRGRIELTEKILNESAVRVETAECSSNGTPNNVYGFGRLNVKAAFELAATRISPVEIAYGMRGGTGRIEVEALEEVQWQAESNASWITITSGLRGIGSGAVEFRVEANTSPNPRAGSISIAGRKTLITQPGLAPLFNVSGNVTTGNSRGVGGVTIVFTRISGGGDIPGSVQTDDNGNWQQEGFEPGTVYRAEAFRSRMNFSPSTRDFSQSAANLNFMSLGRRVAFIDLTATR